MGEGKKGTADATEEVARQANGSDDAKQLAGAQKAELIETEDNSEAEEALRQAKVTERITELAAATKDTALSCAALDFKIMKPYIQPLNLLLYAAAAGFLSFTAGNVFFGFLAGFLLGTLYLSYPFAIRDKYETDKLFADAGLSPQSVVAGRYLFSLGFSLIVALASIVLASVGVQFARSLEPISLVPGIAAGSHGVMTSLILLYLILILVQMPFYFRLGFVGARFIGLLPVGVTALVGAGLAWAGAGEVLLGMHIILEAFAHNPWITVAYLVAAIFVGLLSYFASLSAYKR